MSGSIITLCSFISGITSLIGCWKLGETALYQIGANREQKLIYRNVENIAPTICFLYSNEGYIEYANEERVQFYWRLHSDSCVCIILSKDSLETHMFNINASNEKVILSEYKTHDIIKKHTLYTYSYSVQDLFDKIDVKIRDYEYEYLIKNNPLKNLECIVAKGYIGDKKIIMVGGQEGAIIQHGTPNSQSVLFLKSFNCQQSIPCFILTYDNQGNLQYAHMIKYVELPQK